MENLFSSSSEMVRLLTGRNVCPTSIRMNQTNHFFDLGYGWLCKHCSAEDAEQQRNSSDHRSESKPFGLPLATWSDATHHTLTCPRCGIQETITS